MKQIITLIAVQFLLFASCGPSQEDETAAKNACQVVQRYEEMKAAEGTDREAITQEFFMSTFQDYVSIQTPRSNYENVKELMKKNCPDKIEMFEEIMKGQ